MTKEIYEEIKSTINDAVISSEYFFEEIYNVFDKDSVLELDYLVLKLGEKFVELITSVGYSNQRIISMWDKRDLTSIELNLYIRNFLYEKYTDYKDDKSKRNNNGSCSGECNKCQIYETKEEQRMHCPDKRQEEIELPEKCSKCKIYSSYEEKKKCYDKKKEISAIIGEILSPTDFIEELIGVIFEE